MVVTAVTRLLPLSCVSLQVEAVQLQPGIESQLLPYAELCALGRVLMPERRAFCAQVLSLMWLRTTVNYQVSLGHYALSRPDPLLRVEAACMHSHARPWSLMLHPLTPPLKSTP